MAQSGEMMREYVEKIKDFYKGDNSEGTEVGNGGSVAVNKQSEVAGKNDMGGSAANIAKGGAEANPDGTAPNRSVKPKGDLVSNPQNKPGANAGKKAFKTKESSTGAEGK